MKYYFKHYSDSSQHVTYTICNSYESKVWYENVKLTTN